MNNDVTQDSIYQDLERENNYWQSAGRDEGITYQSGWKERWEATEDPR